MLTPGFCILKRRVKTMTEGAGERLEHELNDDFGLSALREVLRLINDSDITEIKIERGGAKLHIRRGAPPAPAPTPFMITPSLAAALPQAMPPLPPVAPFQQHATSPIAPADAPEALPNGQPITSPMVGTF